MKLNEEDDFGFSLVSEAELKSIEETLSQQVADKEAEAAKAAAEAAKLAKTVQLTTEQSQAKIEGLVKMIMPLLNNLMTEPSKEYIYWPDRVEKIKKFKAKVEAYIKQ